MRIKAELGTMDAVAEVCQEYFGKSFVADNQIHLLPEYFLDVEQAHATNTSEQQKILVDIESSLKFALRKLKSLHPDVRRAVERQAERNLEADRAVQIATFAEIEGKMTPYVSGNQFTVLVETALATFLGVASENSGLEFLKGDTSRSVSAAATSTMSEQMKDINVQERANETWQKALTVKKCREIWAMATGVPAPSYISEGKDESRTFGDFLANMIEALGKSEKWTSHRAVMNAWHQRSEQNEWFL